MITQILDKLIKRQSLTVEESARVFSDIFDGKLNDSQIAGLLVALRAKGESYQEILGATRVIRERALKVNIRREFMKIQPDSYRLLDTCGTGGSGVPKFNISTAVAFICAASGITVVKHGNRAMSSRSGSADVLERLGIKIDIPPVKMEKIISSVGIGFLYAPLYHPALKNVASIRRELGIRTIFNILGPLCNPAGANYQLLGVYDRDLINIIAKVLSCIKIRKAFVVYGSGLKDEVSLVGKTKVGFVKGRRIEYLDLYPRDFGLRKYKLEDFFVKDARESAEVIMRIFSQKEKSSYRDIVLANAACCFYILGVVKSLKEGVNIAKHMIDTGKARQKLEEFREAVNRISGE